MTLDLIDADSADEFQIYYVSLVRKHLVRFLFYVISKDKCDVFTTRSTTY